MYLTVHRLTLVPMSVLQAQSILGNASWIRYVSDCEPATHTDKL